MARLGHRGGIRVLLLRAAIVAFVIPPDSVEAAGTCATPGRDGTATLNSVLNTYYPGALTAAAGATTITLGTATGAGTPMAVGDLVVVIQMQDAAIDSANTGAYGNGIAGDPASGWTGLNSAGLYEYAVATSAVPLVGGALTISSGLLNTYTSALPTPLQGQRNFQVIRVPQYVTATLAGGPAAGAFDGSTGGVLVFDVDGALNLNGVAVSVSQEGFRAGLGRQLAGGAGGSGTDYVNLSASPFHGQKGEGLAGPPQYVYNSLAGTTANNLIDGYPNGSTERAAPGTAGGAGTDPHPPGNDQTTGGGGGANGGTGGMGGNSWNSNLPMGGFGGTAFPATAARLTAGAGGGAGSRNNSAGNASTGGSGGGIVMIRTGSATGTGTITADGGIGVTPLNDGGGGGGAGSSIVVVTQTGALAGLTANARGGVGTNAWPADAGGATDYHGPGGGGGGGVVLMTSALGTVNLNGGANGTTTTAANAYGATPGTAGTQAIITASQIPGAGSGASCTSDLTIAKSHTDPFVRGSTGTYNLTVSNVGGTATSGTSTVSDTLPAGLTFVAATPSQGTYTSGTGVWDIGAIASGASVTLALTATVTATGSLTNTASKTAENETDLVAANNSASVTITGQAPDLTIAKSHVGSFVRGSTGSYSLTVSNIGAAASSGSVTVSDTLPAGLTPSTASGTGWGCGVAGETESCARAQALVVRASSPVIANRGCARQAPT